MLGVAIARGLGPEPYGRYGVALAVATIVAPMADIGATQYIIREAARAPAHAAAVAGTLLIVKSVLAVAALAVAGVIAWLLVEDAGLATALVVMLAAALVEGVTRFVFGYFQGRERMGFQARSTVVTALARTAGGIVVLVTVHELVAVLLWLLAVSLVQLAAAALRIRRVVEASREARSHRPGLDRIAWRSVAAMGIVTVVVMIYLRADTVLVAWLLDERAAGWYTAAYTLMSSLQIAPWMLATALAPVFARSFGRDVRLFHSAWHEGLKSVLVVSLPLALVLCLLAGPIISRVFGAEFDRSVPVLEILAWACPLAGINVVAAAVMRASGREGWLFVVSAAGALFNVGVNVWAIPAIGIEGAAVVTVSTELGVFVGLTAIAARYDIVPVPRLPYWRLAGGLAALAAVALLARSLPVEVAVVGALSAYAVVCLRTGVVRAADLSVLRAAVARRS